MIIYQFKEP